MAQHQRPELSPELAKELDQLNAEKKYRYFKNSVEETSRTLKELNEKVKDVAGFWPAVMAAHPQLAVAQTSSSDQDALSYLTGVELKQDSMDPRPYEIVFHFKENPYFSNTTLTKKYVLPDHIAPVKDGKITKETWDYEVEDLKSTGTKIQWKSDDKNLTAKMPRKGLENSDDEEWDGDLGSFFHFFEEDSDPLNIGHLLQDEILPDAYDYFTGEAGESDDEGEFDELDDDEDDEGSIDLEEDEQPKKKKQRN